jgi:NADH-quinone oxidoreductase subunit J
MGQTNASSRHKWVTGGIVTVLMAVLAYAITMTPWQTVNEPAPISTVGPIGELLLNQFVIPFEAVSILLLVAVLGAIILTKGERK